MSNTNLLSNQLARSCQLVIVPYWLLEVMKGQSLPVKTLVNFDELSRIITATDLEFCTKMWASSNRLVEAEPRLKCYMDTLTIYSMDEVRQIYQGEGKVSATSLLARRAMGETYHYYGVPELTQIVKPAGPIRVTADNGMDITLFVIDDSRWDDPQSGQLLLGGFLSELNPSNDIKADELNRLNANMALLSKYYGISGLAMTPLMARFIELTQPTAN